MNSWERFNETSLPDTKDFYSKLNLENIIDKDYTHAQKMFEELKVKNLGDYHDLYVQVIHYCLQMYLKTLETSALIYMNLTLLIFFLTEVALELLTDSGTLLMTEKGWNMSFNT